MISSTKSSDHAARLNAVATAGQTAARSSVRHPDKFSTEHAAVLRSALAAQPEVRPEVVARARALASDPNYPSLEIINRIGIQILGSPDLSEDQS